MKKILFILVIMCVGISAQAQINSFVSFQYSIGFGTGDIGNFVSKPSFRGATFEWRKFVNENVGVGLEAGWNVFYEAKSSDTYTLSTLSLTGKQYRYQNQLPILFGVDYYLKPGEDLNPFIGLGMGTMYSRRNTDMSTYTLEEQAWHFAVRPEIGLLYKMNDATSAFVAVKYYNGFTSGDFDASQSYVTFNIGLAFTR